MLVRFASLVASLFLLSACANRAPQAAPSASVAPSPPSASLDAAPPKAPVEAHVILEADDESWVLVTPLPAGAAKGAKRSIELGGRKLYVKDERPVETATMFTLSGAANDARCVTAATSHAIVHLSDAKASWDAYRVKRCSGRNSFVAVRGAHEDIAWVDAKAVEIASPKNVRAHQVTLEGVAARITEITTLGRDRHCTHATGFSVSITTEQGMLDLEDASVRGAVLVGESSFIFLDDPRAPGMVKLVRIENGRADRVFEGELDNHQDGVDCVGG